MLFDQKRADTIVSLLQGSSSEELTYVVSILSGDYATNSHSTMGTMAWLFNTAPCDRTELKPGHSYRNQAHFASLIRK